MRQQEIVVNLTGAVIDLSSGLFLCSFGRGAFKLLRKALHMHVRVLKSV